MGWADVGYHGSTIRTPNIDRLQKDGAELDMHYVAPMCTPTRVGLLTEGIGHVLAIPNQAMKEFCPGI